MSNLNENFEKPQDESTVETSENDVLENENFEEYQENQSAPYVLNKISYSEDLPHTDYKSMHKGLKVFCGIMAAIILLLCVCTAGYFIGRKSVSGSHIGAEIDLELESKPDNKDTLDASTIYNQIYESIVGIRVYNDSGAVVDATGMVYTQDGYIITNDHVFSEIGAAKFKIFMHDNTEYDAVFVAGDSISDLAILKIENVSNLKPVTFGDSNEIVFGERIVAIGRPNDPTSSSSITSGIVSLPKTRVRTTSNYTSSLIQFDAPINPGFSGGALVNAYGQVIGVTSSKLSGEYIEGVSYAIPSATVKRVVEQLVKNGKVIDRAKLGITYTEIDSVTAEIKDNAVIGLYVVTVSEESDIYGYVSEGDIITHINGIKITKDDIVIDIIEQSKAGEKITLTVVSKDGAQTDYDVTLKANIGQSSYSQEITEQNPNSNSSSNSSSSNGTFDFPFGD